MLALLKHLVVDPFFSVVGSHIVFQVNRVLSHMTPCLRLSGFSLGSLNKQSKIRSMSLLK